MAFKANSFNPQWDRVFPFAYDASRFWAICAHYMSAMYDLLCLAKGGRSGVQTNNLFDESIDIDVASFFIEEPSTGDKSLPVNWRNWDKHAPTIVCPYTRWFNYLQVKAYAGVKVSADTPSPGEPYQHVQHFVVLC
eukprot:UN02485